MYGLRQAIPAESKMKTGEREFQELIAELRIQFDEVRGKTEFLKLKQSELRPGDEISFFGFLEAMQSLAIEQSLLAGHARMVQENIQTKHLVLSFGDRKILETIVAYSRHLYFL